MTTCFRYFLETWENGFRFLNVCTMKKYRDNEGRRVVEVDSLAFLYERYGYSWLKRHVLNRRHKRALRRADVVTAPDAEVAYEIEKYYFIPKETVTVK